MANELGYYVPEFYAQEALIQLEKALGMAGRVHRGYDNERRTFGKGEVINISRPSTFTEENAPSAAQDIKTDSVQIKLDQWKEVKFKLTDKELTFAKDKIIEDHIRPAAYTLAEGLDSRLCDLYKFIPWFYAVSATPEVKDVTGPRQVMFDNKVPMGEVGRLHYMVDGALEAGFLNLAAFSQHQGAGDLGVNSQLRGSLGTKYGLEVFSNQNVKSHEKGTANNADLKVADGPGGTWPKGSEIITLEAETGTVSGTLEPGDSFVIAGHTQRYVVTEQVTAGSDKFTNVKIFPALARDYADDTLVTVRLEDKVCNLAFHRNAFALAMAPLSDMGRELGAKIASITDPVSGLSIRSRIYYVGNSSEVHVALDILYGIKCLDANLAVRCEA